MAKIDEKFMKADRSLAKKMGLKIKDNKQPAKKSGSGSGTKKKK